MDATQGPLIVYGSASPGIGLGGAQDSNGQAGPSLFFAGMAIADPRPQFSYKPGSDYNQKGVYGWMAPVLDCVPFTATAGAIAAAAHTTNGTAMTLVGSTGNGVTVGASVVNALTGNTVTGLLAIGGAMGSVGFGSQPQINIWDPTKALARVVGITGISGGSGGHFIVSGFDIYGFPMTENINAGAGAGQTLGKKAWKYITSVVPQFTDGTGTYSIDTTDTIGFPLRVDEWGYADISMNNSFITASTGFTAADTTSPATSTTGDTRGTYALQTVSNNSDRLVMFITPSVANIGSAVGLTGVQPA